MIPAPPQALERIAILRGVEAAESVAAVVEEAGGPLEGPDEGNEEGPQWEYTGWWFVAIFYFPIYWE